MSDDTLDSVADELVLCRADPVRFVETMFDWDGPELKGKAPEPWQREVLCGVRDGLPLNKAVRIAVIVGTWCRQDGACVLVGAVGNQHMQRLPRNSDGIERSAACDAQSRRIEEVVPTLSRSRIFRINRYSAH